MTFSWPGPINDWREFGRPGRVSASSAAIKEIWTEDEAEFHGEYVDFDPIFCWPKPWQRPHPPIDAFAALVGDYR